MWIEKRVIDPATWDRYPVILSISDLSSIFRMKETTIFKWLELGKIPGHKMGGPWIVFKEEVRQELEEPDEPYRGPVEWLSRFPDELTVPQLAEILGRKPPMAYRLLKRGIVEAIKHEGFWLVSKLDVVRALEKTRNRTT